MFGTSAVTVPVAEALRAATHALALPQGFTLSVSGVLAAMIGRTGPPGWVGVWLYAAGAAVAFVSAILASGAHRERVHRPLAPSGMALLNVAPLAVIPAAVSAASFIHDPDAAFFVSGFLTSSGYVVVVAIYTAAVCWRCEPPDVSATGGRPYPDPAAR